VVASWIAEVEGERLAALHALNDAPDAIATADELLAVLDALDPIREVLARADDATKARVYADLGVTMTYRSHDDVVDVEARPAFAYERVGGTSWTIRPRGRFTRSSTLHEERVRRSAHRRHGIRGEGIDPSDVSRRCRREQPTRIVAR
jgi:hypothetical protein